MPKYFKSNVKRVLRLTAIVFSLASVAFVATVALIGLLYGGASFFQLLLLCIVIYFAAVLESVQQAANSAKSIENDVTNKFARSEKHARKLIILKDSETYEAFSSGRQFASIFCILGLKASLDAMITDDFSASNDWPRMISKGPDWQNYWYDPFAALSIDLASFLSNDLALFFFSAMFIAWFLQLVPKRLARNQAVESFSYWRLWICSFLICFGKYGLSAPVELAQKTTALALGVSGNETKYPPSAEAQINDLASRFGFYARETRIQILIGKDVKILEQAVYRISESSYQRDVSIPGLTHRLSIDGKWQVIGTEVDTAHSNRETSMIHREEKVAKISETNFPQPGNIPSDEETDVLFADEDDFDENYDEQRSLTGTATKINFTTRIQTKDPPFEEITVNTLLKSLDEDYMGSEIRDYEFGIHITVPTKRCVIEIYTTNNVPPSSNELSARDVFGELSDDANTFEEIDPKCLIKVPRATHGVRATVAVPVFGSKLSISTRC